jgi:hypothetical protein
MEILYIFSESSDVFQASRTLLYSYQEPKRSLYYIYVSLFGSTASLHISAHGGIIINSDMHSGI